MSDKELEALNHGGIRGCRFAFLKRLGGVGDMAKFNRIVHRVAELGWHVDVYFEPGTVGEFASILSAIPLYAPDPAVRQKLLVENPARLFQFG
jgi:predicted TIM-barrel fold metal-dependent hydrolase